MQVALTDHADSPFDNVAHHEVRQRVEEELRKVPEPYRTTLMLRDLEDMSYEEIAEVLRDFAGHGEIATDARAGGAAAAAGALCAGGGKRTGVDGSGGGNERMPERKV